MARHEQDREDLLREATALMQRVEIRLADGGETFVVGFRRDGSGSLFVGGDPVFQFNRNNELRRGFWNGKLIKAEKGRLVELTRIRTPAEVQLRRRAFDATQTDSFLELCRKFVQQLLTAVANGKYTVVGKVPRDADLVAPAAGWLKVIADDIRIADRPNVS